MLQICQRKLNGEYCMLRGVMNPEIRHRRNTKDIVSVAHSLMWKWGSHVARMDQRRWPHTCIIVGCKDRQRENWETEDLMADMFQRETREHWSGTAKTRSEWSRCA